MADLKPLGSEKLNGDDKLKRILELTYFNDKNKKSSSVKPELVKESKTGGVYGIVKEKDGYYVKRGLNESSLDYIGGMFMKNKNRFSSYADAYKRLDFIKGQEELQEATKYVLKQNKPQEEAPMPEPSMDLPPSPEADTSGDMGAPMGDTTAPSDDAAAPVDDMGGEDVATDDEAGKRSSYMAEAQKFAGKLGQELRDLQDKMESDDIKYILNMVISAVKLDNLDDEDIEEIGKKFERDEDEMESEEPSIEDEVPSEEPAVEPESEMNEYDSMDALEAFINNPIEPNEPNEIDLSKYSQLGSIPEEDELKELDLEEIKKDINQAIGERLSKYFS
jgi:hypothetical protein